MKNELVIAFSSIGDERRYVAIGTYLKGIVSNGSLSE